MSTQPRISVIAPSMPTTVQLKPYLQAIEANGVHSNRGPLVKMLENIFRVGGLPGVALTNATVGLELALRALRLPHGSLVLVPAVTYQATGLAVLNAGLTPLICDVSEKSWTLTPDIAEFYCSLGIRAVVPVCAFGAVLDQWAWEAFSLRTKIPVLIDAAGQPTQPAPVHFTATVGVVHSFHATKLAGGGEGGMFKTGNSWWRERVCELSVFGNGNEWGGTNAKMSEYAAAVTLASLSTLDERVLTHQVIWKRYLNKLDGAVRAIGSPTSSILPVLLPDDGEIAEQIGHTLREQGVETRRWYVPFLHNHPALRKYAKGIYRTADMLERCLLGLPYHTKLTFPQVDYVCEKLKELL